MDMIIVLFIIGVVYGVLLFFDNFFKTCAHYPYIKFLEGTGFHVGFFWIRWKTKAFNRILIRWGASRPRFWNIWFTIGVGTSLLILPFSVLLLLYSVLKNWTPMNTSEAFVIEPIIPGVNLPASELGYYSLTLIVCSIVHELGHALAAVKEDVNLIEVGANIFFVLPVAFVNISTEKLTSSCLKSLKVLCAGVWHNIVLTLVALLMYMSIPFLFSPFFHIDKGIVISEIAKNSPLLGTKGLSSGDVVFQVNDCKVFNEDSWYNCLSETYKRRIAFCIDADLIRNFDESIALRHLENGNLECCSENQAENICFEYLDKSNGILELPMHACLPARKVMEQSEHFCDLSPHICPDNQFCFKPILENSTHLFKLNSNHRDVIYLGHPSDIHRTIMVSSFIPKYIFTSPTIPDAVLKFIKYLIVFSLGLAILNIIPFMYMDGQYIMEIVGCWFFEKKYGKNMTRAVISIVTWFLTFLLVSHCLYSASKIINL
ncbi:membrane-bound transcription factor site-2 protease [Leptinotarsa decemlineata]|uniref:membrane-bound transcription factor site-2 protease n=1 Tax=Leptinotarsa decemlineata TaxID=7539 RepID=UPI003D3050AC